MSSHLFIIKGAEVTLNRMWEYFLYNRVVQSYFVNTMMMELICFYRLVQLAFKNLEYTALILGRKKKISGCGRKSVVCGRSVWWT